jgi:hypothetical protein
MPLINDQLKNASLENRTSDPSAGTIGRAWCRTDTSPRVVKWDDGSSIRTVVTTDNTQTLTNKTLTAPVIDAASMTEQGSTPASPSSGTRKLYVKTDGYPYLLDSAGTETRIGTGSSSTINYILNPDAETDTTGWALYNDGATATPVDGTSGSASGNVALSRSTTDPIRGAAHFLLTKSNAASIQGQGVSYDFTIARADQAKVHAISFEYKTSSNFTAGDSSDIRVYVYDVFTGVFCPVTPNTIQGNGDNYQKFYGTFQSSAGSRSYRLIFHVATSDTDNWTFAFDNVVVGPQTAALGSPITDWDTSLTFTPVSAAFGTLAASNIQSRRIGGDIHVRGWFTAGTTAASTASITLPIGIDTNRISTTTNKQRIGTATALNTSTGDVYSELAIFFDGSTTGSVYITDQQGTTTNQLVKRNGSDVLGTGCTLTFEFSYPASGLSSNVLMSNDADTRVCVARYYSTAGQSIPDNTETIIDFATKSYDTHAAVTTGASWKFTAPISGYYRVNLNVDFVSSTAWTIGESAYFTLKKNGTTFSYPATTRLHVTGANAGVSLNGSDIIQLNAGDYISLYVAQNTGGSLALDTTGGSNFVSVERISGPSAVMAAERVFARYSTNTAQSISNNSATVVNFEDVTTDSHAAVTVGASWKFTAPRADVYRVSSIVSLASDAGWEVGETAYIALYKNGSIYSYLNRFICQATATMTVSMNGSDEVSLNAGDYIQIYVYQNSDGAIALDGGTEQNRVSISAVGNK